LPQFLSSRFALVREFAAVENVYANGEIQSRSLVTTARRSWQLTAHVTPTILGALRTFLFARRWIEPFYFYDGTETSPKWLHDPTGVVSTGRYTVVARGIWVQSMGIARGSVDLRLEEVT
jgi:hypothetical protein